MDKQKIRISIIDFLPEFRKHPTGKTDCNGKDICYGDIVKLRDQTHFVSYRYGNICLKQPGTIHTINLTDYSQVEVTNICGAAQDYLIIGYDDEPFIQELQKLNLELS
jgi:hypothetical protein